MKSAVFIVIMLMKMLVIHRGGNQIFQIVCRICFLSAVNMTINWSDTNFFLVIMSYYTGNTNYGVLREIINKDQVLCLFIFNVHAD